MNTTLPPLSMRGKVVLLLVSPIVRIQPVLATPRLQKLGKAAPRPLSFYLFVFFKCNNNEVINNKVYSLH